MPVRILLTVHKIPTKLFKLFFHLLRSLVLQVWHARLRRECSGALRAGALRVASIFDALAESSNLRLDPFGLIVKCHSGHAREHLLGVFNIPLAALVPGRRVRQHGLVRQPNMTTLVLVPLRGL